LKDSSNESIFPEQQKIGQLLQSVNSSVLNVEVYRELTCRNVANSEASHSIPAKLSLDDKNHSSVFLY